MEKTKFLKKRAALLLGFGMVTGMFDGIAFVRTYMLRHKNILWKLER